MTLHVKILPIFVMLITYFMSLKFNNISLSKVAFSPIGVSDKPSLLGLSLFKEMEQICGIYKIINLSNNKFYIGSSVNIKNRIKTHFSKLRHNKHDNSHLQNSFNKHGEHQFTWELIKLTNIKLLEDRELFYIISLKPQYNISTETIRTSIFGRKHTIETRRKQSISHGGSGILKEERVKNHIKKSISHIMKEKTLNYWASLTPEARKQKNAYKEGKYWYNRTGKPHTEESKNKTSESMKKYWTNKKNNNN